MLTMEDCCKSEEELQEWHPNMGRFNLNRLLYACLLSIPNFRYRIKLHKRDIPNVEASGPLWPISKATLNARISEHVEDLFDLGYRPKYFAREHKRRKRHSGQGPFPGGHWAMPGALITSMKVRTTHLAVPNRRYAMLTKKYYGKRLSEKQKKILDVYVDNAKKTIYYMPPVKTKVKPPKRSKCEGVGFRWPRRQPKGEKKKELNMERLNVLATPTPVRPPPQINRGKKGNVDDISDDLEKLATPPPRYFVKKEDPNKVFQVKKGALTYNCSDRVAEIALPKPVFAEPPTTPFVVSRAALTYKISERVEKLAAARERKDPPSETKEDPFGINPIALKAMCTPRTAELAEPVVRK